MKFKKLNESVIEETELGNFFNKWDWIEVVDNSFQEELEEKLEQAYMNDYEALYDDYENYPLYGNASLIFAKGEALNVLLDLAEEYGYSLGWDEILEDEYGITEKDVINCKGNKERIKKLFGLNESLNENYIPNETFNGTDDEFEELENAIFDRCKNPDSNRIELTIYDIDGIEYDDLTLNIPEYTYDNFEGWEFGGSLLDDLAEFLDKSINQITQQDVNTFDVDKFLEFLSDKYRDNIIEEMEDDVSFMDSAYEEEIDKLEGEASEPN